MLKYFSYSEFDSPDEIGTGVKMSAALLTMLDEARDIAGVPFIITSGYRTEYYNSLLRNSKPDSSHLEGLAVDIYLSLIHI